MSKPKAKQHELATRSRGPVFSARFMIAVLLIVVGIAWIAYYYIAQVDPRGPGPRPAAARRSWPTSATGTT